MPAMIEISKADKTFTLYLRGGVRLAVVYGMNREVHPGECVVLSRPSSAGKSAILKIDDKKRAAIAVAHDDEIRKPDRRSHR